MLERGEELGCALGGFWIVLILQNMKMLIETDVCSVWVRLRKAQKLRSEACRDWGKVNRSLQQPRLPGRQNCCNLLGIAFADECVGTGCNLGQHGFNRQALTIMRVQVQLRAR